MHDKNQNIMAIKIDVCYKFLWHSILSHQWILKWKKNINKHAYATHLRNLFCWKLLRLSVWTHNIVLAIFLINFFFRYHSFNHPRFFLLFHSLHFDLCKDWKNFISLSVCKIPVLLFFPQLLNILFGWTYHELLMLVSQ